MWVTAYTDASFFRKIGTPFGTWGIKLLTEDRTPIEQSGVCPPYCDDITKCEVYAACMAVVHAMSTYKKTITAVKIITDNNFVFNFLKRGAPMSKNLELVKMQLMFWEYTTESGLMIKIDKVAAHSGGNSKHEINNGDVDRAARKELAIELHKKGFKKRTQRQTNSNKRRRRK